MSPSAKFNALLSSTTVSIMFFLVAWAAPILKALGEQYPLVLPASGLVLSAGVYRFLEIGIRWLMERSTWVSQKVMGPFFVHGTWVGWFEGHSGELRYMIEHFTQDLDGLVITGRSFDVNLKEHSYWESGAASVDAKVGKLVYTYKLDVLKQKTSLFGIHTSFLARNSAHEHSTAFSGFAHDLDDTTRIAVHSHKISADLKPWATALQEVVEIYKKSVIK